jgi:hypothetical protein
MFKDRFRDRADYARMLSTWERGPVLLFAHRSPAGATTLPIIGGAVTPYKVEQWIERGERFRLLAGWQHGRLLDRDESRAVLRSWTEGIDGRR